jgi:hypothetical protein
MCSSNRIELSLSNKIREYIEVSDKECKPSYPVIFKISNGESVKREQFIMFCDSIAKLLMNIELCCAYISDLEKLVTDKLASMPEEKSRVKVLRNILEAELFALGFYPKFGKAISSYPPASFFTAMKSGLMIKDGKEGYSDHGEFTHIIQWVIIAWHQKKTNFLGLPAIDVFKMMGLDQSGDYQNVWDMLFEAEETQDFRSPETLNKFICGKTPELSSSAFPTLSKLLLERRAKRAKEFGKRQLIESSYEGKYNRPLLGPGYFTPIGFDDDNVFTGERYRKL